MTTIPETVGDLSAGTEVLRVAGGRVVHRPDSEHNCPHLTRETTRVDAGTLWADTPICRFCAGRFEPDPNPPGATLPMTTEVPEL